MKDKLGDKSMTEFVALRHKTCFYSVHNDNSDKKLKEQRSV